MAFFDAYKNIGKLKLFKKDEVVLSEGETDDDTACGGAAETEQTVAESAQIPEPLVESADPVPAGDVPEVAKTVRSSDKSSLFPEGHGVYELQPDNASGALAVVKSDCPLCKHSFENHFLLSSKLKRDKTDVDMRARFAGIEPMHYSITTCPECLFSAESETFADDISKRDVEPLQKAIAPYKGMNIKIGKERDMESVFASYYLALVCAPVFIERHELATASLWLKICRLYEDCGDKQMNLFALSVAREKYGYVYSHIRLPDKQSEQIAFVLAELNYKLGDYETARTLFYPLKKARGSSQMFIRAVEDRLEACKVALGLV